MQLDGHLLKRWLHGPESVPAKLLGLTLDHVKDERGGVIEGHDASAFSIIDPAHGQLRVPFVALTSWVLVGVPDNLKALIEQSTIGITDEDQARLQIAGFVPAALSRTQCTTALKMLSNPGQSSVADVEVMKGILQSGTNSRAAHLLLEAVRQRGYWPASDAARHACVNIASFNPTYKAELDFKRMNEDRQRWREYLYFSEKLLYPERIRLAEEIFARSDSCQDLDQLDNFLGSNFWRSNWDEDPVEEAAAEAVYPAVEELRNRIKIRQQELGCDCDKNPQVSQL